MCKCSEAEDRTFGVLEKTQARVGEDVTRGAAGAQECQPSWLSALTVTGSGRGVAPRVVPFEVEAEPVDVQGNRADNCLGSYNVLGCRIPYLGLWNPSESVRIRLPTESVRIRNPFGRQLQP